VNIRVLLIIFVLLEGQISLAVKCSEDGRPGCEEEASVKVPEKPAGNDVKTPPGVNRAGDENNQFANRADNIPNTNSPQDKPAETPQQIEIRRRQERAAQIERNLEETIQKVGAKTDRQARDSEGNVIAPENIRHRSGDKPDEWTSYVGDKADLLKPAPAEALSIPMPGSTKKALDERRAANEQKLDSVVKQLESGKMDPEEKARVEILIAKYQKDPSDANANQIIAQVVNIGEGKAVAPSSPAPEIEASPEILRPSEVFEPSALVIETKSSDPANWGSDTGKKLSEITSLLKTEKKTVTPSVLAAKELSDVEVAPMRRSPTNSSQFKDEANVTPFTALKSTAKAWMSKLIQALVGKPEAPERGIASVPDIDQVRGTASTPELKVDPTIHSVEGAVGPLTAAILNPEPTSPAPLLPPSLLVGLALAFAGALLLLAKVRR